MTTTLDLSFVRDQFPAFREAYLEGWRFFDNAGGSYACGGVIDRLHRYYRETKIQPYGEAAPSRRPGEEMDQARSRWAEYLNVHADEIQFGPSTSQNTYVLAQAFRAGWSEGDEIVVTNQDHEANIGAWRRLDKTGINVKQWSANPDTGELDIDELKKLLTDRTRLVACTHASNIVASPNPIPAIAEVVHAAGAKLVVDGVAYAPHALPDLRALGADVYLFSLYKTYGPHQGLLFVEQTTSDGLANQSHYFNDGEKPKRLIPAGPDHAQVSAASGVLDYLEALDAHHFSEPASPNERRDRLSRLMREAEQTRLAPLMDFLSTRKVRVLGPTDPMQRLPTVALDTEKLPYDVSTALAEHKIIAGASDFYAPRIIETMGGDSKRGVLRLSFVHYTSADDIATLIMALDRSL